MELNRLEHSHRIWVHEPEDCQAQDVCSIHKRSDHHMRSFPQHWRDDRGLMERICPHGVGHPDPDHLWRVAFVRGDLFEATVHGCDGCCAPKGDT